MSLCIVPGAAADRLLPRHQFHAFLDPSRQAWDASLLSREVSRELARGTHPSRHVIFLQKEVAIVARGVAIVARGVAHLRREVKILAREGANLLRESTIGLRKSKIVAREPAILEHGLAILLHEEKIGPHDAAIGLREPTIVLRKATIGALFAGVGCTQASGGRALAVVASAGARWRLALATSNRPSSWHFWKTAEMSVWNIAGREVSLPARFVPLRRPDGDRSRPAE